jgi:apolipoprotein D and lipocalin family protein
MKRVFKAALLVGGVAAGAAVYALADHNIDAPRTVDFVDLGRYAGQWYEIARFPNRFQRTGCCDVTASYALLPNGRVSVVNACRNPNGGLERISGTARVMDRKTNAKLKVTFFWPFAGDYWILDLGSDYEYAVVGDPGRNYLWILSRTPQMDAAAYQRIITRLEARGLDTARLVRTPQSGQLLAEAVAAGRQQRAR